MTLLTSATVVPLPSAILFLRCPLMSVVVFPFSLGHGVDDRLDFYQLPLVDIDVLDFIHPRYHTDDVFERPHVAHLLELVPEVAECKGVVHDRLLELLGLFLVKGLLGLLYEGEDVAHAEYPRRDPFGVERFEHLDLLAGADEFDRLAGYGDDRQCGAAPCVAVHLGEDDAVDADLLGKVLRDIDRVLAGHRVGDEKDLFGYHAVFYFFQLGHQRVVDVEPSGGVEDEDITRVELRLFD